MTLTKGAIIREGIMDSIEYPDGSIIRQQNKSTADKVITSAIYPLSKGYYTVETFSQQPPNEGNHVRVKITLFLPSEPNYEMEITTCRNQHLDDYEIISCDLIFGKKVKFGGEPLWPIWGERHLRNGYKWKELYRTSNTWARGFAKGERYARAEFKRLEKVLKKRNKALADAEDLHKIRNRIIGDIKKGGLLWKK